MTGRQPEEADPLLAGTWTGESARATRLRPARLRESGAMTVTTEVLDTVAPVADEWEALATRLDATPFASPGWTVAWLRAFGAGSPVVLAARRDGRLTGVLALQRRGGAVRSPTNWHTPLFEPVAEDAATLAALARAVYGLGPRSVHLWFLDPGGEAFDPLTRAAVAAGYATYDRACIRSPFVAIRGDWPTYLACRSRNLRKGLDRSRRRLEEAGCVVYETRDGREGLVPLLDEGLAVEAAGWKGERGTAIASRPCTRLFYEEMARWAAKAGALRLSFLRLDGRPIAFELALESGGHHYSLKVGYDPEFRRYSPGTLLTSWLIERAFARGLASFELLGADDPDKLRWTTSVRELRLVQAFSGSASGRAERLAHVYGRPVAKRLVACGRRVRIASGSTSRGSRS